jgi:two-component system sensor histidine kinase PilS (NtrC family)
VHVLAGALKDMLERLEQSRHELARQESLASVGSMAAVLAHEIRTPLAVLRGSADMLAKKVAGDARGEELVSLLQEETDRLSRLASDLLVFARPRPPERAAVDLTDVARRAAGMLKDRFVAAAVDLELATSPAPVLGDAEQLGQAALNLLNNALEFSPRGMEVRVETGRSAGGAFLRVADAGPGIPPESLERIWLPFFTTRRGGTGLGLPIVRQIVEAHGGRAEIDSSPGAGTRVTLILPEEAAP